MRQKKFRRKRKKLLTTRAGRGKITKFARAGAWMKARNRKQKKFCER